MMDRLSKNSKSRLPQRIPQTVSSRRFLHEKSLFTQRSLDEGITCQVDNDDDDNNKQDVINENQGNYSGLCGLCHLTVGKTGPRGNNIGFEQPFCCSRGHLMCQRCVQHLGIASDIDCVLCGGGSQSSRSSNPSLIDNDYEVSRELINEVNDGHWDKVSYIDKQETPSFRDGFSDWEMTLTHGDNLTREHESFTSLMRKDDGIVMDEGMKINGGSFECSRRPIQCPRLDCSMNIAFSALIHHFLFDHPEVPILSVEPGTKSTLIVSFSGLVCESSRCLAVLLVSGKLSGSAARLFNGAQIHPKYRNRLPLPVLAARLHCSNRYIGGEGHGQGDIIIAWVAGLDIASVGALRCSIQAVDSLDSDGIRSLTYTGPINSLRTAQRPREVFHTGDCVILHEGLLNQLTSDCSTLNINVTVH